MTIRRGSTRRRHLAIVAGFFLASRLVFIAGGVDFRAEASGQDQLLDAKRLVADPFLAFTSNHIQPPLWNFFVGSVYRWSPFPAGISFQVIYLVAGLVTVVALWEILRDLGAAPWIASTSTVVVALSPLLVFNEAILRYETLETAVLTLSALAFVKYVARPSPLRLAAFAIVLVAGVLTRTTLQPLWLVGGLVIVLICRPPRGWWRPALGIVAGALLLVAIPIVHRAVAFDTVGLSSFWGMNVKRIAVMQLPEHVAERLVDEGKLSRIALVNGPYASYAPYLEKCRAHSGEPALDEITKSDGDINFNALCMIPVYEIDAKDSLAAIRAEPGVYARSVGQAAVLYASWPEVRNRSGVLAGWDRMYAPLTVPVGVTMVLGSGDPQPVAATFSGGRARLSLTVVAALLLAIAYGLRGLARMVRGRATVPDHARVYIAFTVVSLTAVSITMDFFENSRFRQPLDPLLLGPLFALGLECAVRAVRFLRRSPSDRGSTRAPDPVTPRR